MARLIERQGTVARLNKPPLAPVGQTTALLGKTEESLRR